MTQKPRTSSPYELPADLPRPVDDGAAGHLIGRRVASVMVRSGGRGGRAVDFAEAVAGKSVVFFSPRTGVPGEAHNLGLGGEDWDTIPGARGCTPQSCGFRDVHSEFAALGVKVFGFSTNTPEHHAEFIARNHIPFEMLSDSELTAVKAMRLPTWEFPIESGGPNTLVKRMAWYVETGVIQKVWYPVFPPDRNAGVVLEWIRKRGGLTSRAFVDADREQLRADLVRVWGSTTIWSRDQAFQADTLDGFVAEVDGRVVGRITLAFDGDECEIVTLSTTATAEDRGAGAALLFRAVDEARGRGCRRVFLTTSNDNLRALGFYQRRRMRICAVYPGMMDRYRERYKPDIPRVSPEGVPVRDEIELELELGDRWC